MEAARRLSSPRRARGPVPSASVRARSCVRLAERPSGHDALARCGSLGRAFPRVRDDADVLSVDEDRCSPRPHPPRVSTCFSRSSGWISERGRPTRSPGASSCHRTGTAPGPVHRQAGPAAGWRRPGSTPHAILLRRRHLAWMVEWTTQDGVAAEVARRNGRVATGPDSVICGCAAFNGQRVRKVFAHPDRQGLGLGHVLLDAVDRHARAGTYHPRGPLVARGGRVLRPTWVPARARVIYGPAG